MTWLDENKSTSENRIYLIDYEFLGYSINGKDLINKINSPKNCYLVTSRYDDKEVTSFCESKKIKLVDKGMIAFVPIKYIPNSKFVLIDDDKLIKAVWTKKALLSNVSLSTYSSIEEFSLNSSNHPKDTIVCIDSSLGNGIKGEVESKKIYDLGYRQLFICTGFNPSDIEKPYWIKEIRGKDPFFF